MGKNMSKARVLIRPLKNYNVDSRAMKEISKEKLKAAPYYPNFQKQPSKTGPIETNANPELLKNLSSVYITSKGDNPTITAKKFPHDRKTPVNMMWGWEEPDVIPQGRMSLKQAYILISQHTTNPEEVTAQKASEQCGISEETAGNIFKYYYTYSAALPIKDKATSTTIIAVKAVEAYFDKLGPGDLDFDKLKLAGPKKSNIHPENPDEKIKK